MPTRRAESADVEPVVGEPVGGQTLGGRRRARTTERVHRREPRVVEQDQQHVGCALWRPQWLDRRELRIGVLGVERHEPRERAIRDR